MVEIRPTKFDKLRIPTLSKAQEVVQSCIVTLRGWDYLISSLRWCPGHQLGLEILQVLVRRVPFDPPD